MKIAIIGAGWSGLSCAHKLKEIDPLNEITIFESAQDAGGRAKGLSWKLSDGKIAEIDNGQHFIIGAYKNTLALLRKTNAPQWTENVFTWNFTHVSDEQKTLKKYELDLDYFFSSFFFKENKWPKHWYFFLVLSIFLAKLKFLKNLGSAKDWLSKSFQPKKLQEVFWRPFIESTTNTDWNEASAKSIIKILLECSINFPQSIKILHPKTNLSKSGVDLIVKNLKENGVSFFFGRTISRIGLKNNHFLCVDNKSVVYEKFDKIIMALPTYAASRIWIKSNFSETDESNNWKLQKTRGINTLWIALPENYKRTKKISNKNHWEIRQLSELYNKSFFVVIERPLFQKRLVLSVVQSAIDFRVKNIQVENSRKIKIAADSYLKWMFNLTLEDCEYKFISEKKATFACQSNMSDKEKLWGSIFTGRDNIWRCSDDCINGFPSTIESAVSSGFEVAKSIMLKANQEHH